MTPEKIWALVPEVMNVPLLVMPLVLPTQKSITAGAAVVYAAPTGVWQIDEDGVQLDYTAPVIQGGIAVPLLQVIL